LEDGRVEANAAELYRPLSGNYGTQTHIEKGVLFTAVFKQFSKAGEVSFRLTVPVKIGKIPYKSPAGARNNIDQERRNSLRKIGVC